MEGLPLLPGYTFRDVTLEDYRLPHKVDIANGYPVVRDTHVGIGKRPTDTASAAYASAPDHPVEYDPSLTYGRTRGYACGQYVPHYVLFSQKCLCFKAFFRQAVHNSPSEHYRVRHVNIVYYLEDDTLCVIEPAVDNAGFRQGKIVGRGKVPKNVQGDPFTWKDLNIGADVCVYGVVYHIVDCDPFTRQYLASQGVDVDEGEGPPTDPYTQARLARIVTPTRVTRNVDDARRRFLEYDRMVLTFDATWNDDRYQLLYFLADDTVAIREIRRPNDGKDPVALLLRRMRVPKDWKNLPSWHPSVYMEYGDAEVTEYYTPSDLRVGETIFVFGRRFLLHDCDAFTRRYYADMLARPQPSAIPLPARTVSTPETKHQPPPHIGFGSPDDTLANCLSLVPKPPRRNVIRQLANFPRKLRYSARLQAAHPEDENRDFVLEYNLCDGTVRIGEMRKRNSGRREGCFLSARLIPKPGSGTDDPLYYTPEDLFVGATVHVFDRRFVITGADLFVYRYVEANSERFCQQLRDNIRNYFTQRGMLLDDVDVEVERIQREQRQVFADDADPAAGTDRS